MQLAILYRSPAIINDIIKKFELSGIITSDIIKDCGYCQLLHKESLESSKQTIRKYIPFFNLIGKDIHYC